MPKFDHGWSEWCRVMAAGFHHAAKLASGTRAADLIALAAHYDAEAIRPNRPITIRKSVRSS
jgi:hypothetical protein